MSERKDEKWLDGELRRVIDGATPEFDAEAWKRKYPAEYQAVLARAAKGRKAGRPRIVRLLLGHPGAGVAVAAAIVIVAALLLRGPAAREPQGPVPGGQTVAQSPAKMVTMMSLTLAYRRGGTEALDQQLDEAVGILRPRSATMPMHELFDDLES
ncbi:MAG: hypothetical protein JW741_15150 [Sedimentisphaerales bacterium]|nr:hypothetical protein [Sedimentisphaerales bacterium]